MIKRYILIPEYPEKSYIKRIEALKVFGMGKPLTFKETIEARVTDYETKYNSYGQKRSIEDRLKLFKTPNGTGTGIAYKGISDRFKIIPDAIQILIDSHPDHPWENPKEIDYSLLDGEEINQKNVKYNELLTKQKVLNHEGWLAAIEGDKTLLKNYCQIIFKSRTEAMAFFIISPSYNSMHELFIDSLGNNSNAEGYDSKGQFVERASINPI